MLNIFDTHFHLFEERYKKETNFSEEELIKKANKNGVKFFCNVGTTIEDSEIVVKQIKKYKNIVGAIGVHPNHAKTWNTEKFKRLEVLLQEKRVLSIGEIGLDYLKNFSTKKEQKKCFEDQLKLAKKYNLSVLLHLRESYDDAFEIIKKLNIKKGIVHCFSGTLEQANKFIEIGFLISISGIVTFSNAKKLQEVVKKLLLENIVVETDAPYLAPTPFRGKINYSEYIKFTIQKISELKNVSFDEVVEKTTKNALIFFNLKI